VVEQMAVNYWVVGSSPTWGASLQVRFNKQKFVFNNPILFCLNKNSNKVTLLFGI
jgi:hypothetical protein